MHWYNQGEHRVALDLIGKVIMNVTLSLTQEETAELERRAAAAGTDVKTFLLHVMHDSAGSDDLLANDMPYDSWKKEFQRWISLRQSRNPVMDDSRESIYD